MNTTTLCPKCGKPLEAGAPQGLCPACLMQGAFATGTEPDCKSPRFVPPAVEELAPKFPQLDLLEFIGQGGMGAVYKARQKELDRVVALKILPPDIGQDAAFAERFTREARALAKLNHPGIVTIHEFGRANGLFFFVMEYVDGVTLRQLLHAGRVSPREALAIVPQICDALQYAHDQGIVHRDIKPENVLLDRRGRVKVADFGLAKIVGANGRAGSPLPADSPLPAEGLPGEGGAQGTARPTNELTDASKVMGTPQYMSPEQIEAPGEVDHRADIYALGVVFYQMLTGELPGRKIEPPSKKVAIDVRLDEVVLRALETKPELRYQQASVLKTEVETIASTPGSSRREEAQTDTAPPTYGLRPELAPRPDAPAASGDEAAFAKARQEVKAPANWLVATGTLNWVAIPWLVGVVEAIQEGGVAYTNALALPWMVLVVEAIQEDAMRGTLLPLVLMGAFVLGGVMIAAGLRMKRLEAHSLAVIGCILAMLVTPGNIIGLPVGIWSLVVLCRREVRESFGRGYLALAAESPPSARSSGSWRVVTVAVVAHAVLWLGVVAFFVTAVPRIYEEFNDFAFALPTETVLVYRFAVFIRNHCFILVPLVLGLDVAICWLVQRFGGRKLLGAWAVIVLLGLMALLLGSLWLLNLPLHIRFSAGATSSPPAGNLPTFGPVMERELTNECVVDFDSGRQLALPEFKSHEEGFGGIHEIVAAVATWMEQRGMDALFEGDLNAYGMKVKPLTEEDWTNLNPSQLAEVIRSIDPQAPPQVLLRSGPAPFAFKTREGAVGLLQITGFTDNPRSVKIRYKLVTGTAGKTKPSREKPDAWGTPFQMKTGEQPLNRKPGVLSAGPDKQFSTADDLEVRPMLTKAPFVARLAEGEVELVALSHYPFANEPWWAPDGGAANEGPFVTEVGGDSSVDFRMFAVVVRLRNMPADASKPAWKVEPRSTWAEGKLLSPDKKADGKLVLIACWQPRSAATANVKVGIASGAWETVARARADAVNPGGQASTNGIAMFPPLGDSEEGVRVTVTHNYKGMDIRLIAVESDGSSCSGTNLFQSLSEAIGHTTMTFPGLSQNEAFRRSVEFHFQVRPYRWVEFHNVSLKPGRRTQVEVRDAAMQAGGGDRQPRGEKGLERGAAADSADIQIETQRPDQHPAAKPAAQSHGDKK